MKVLFYQKTSIATMYCSYNWLLYINHKMDMNHKIIQPNVSQVKETSAITMP
jgi:hypothetical protein